MSLIVQLELLSEFARLHEHVQRQRIRCAEWLSRGFTPQGRPPCASDKSE